MNKIKYVLLSTNDNLLYIQFWPIVATAWRNWGVEPLLSLVTNRPYDSWKWMEDYGKIYQFNERLDLPTKNWSTVVRYYLYYLNLDDISIVSDMDMIPLSKDYLLSLPDGFDKTDNLIIKGYDAYIQHTANAPDNAWAGPSSFPKFPGCYMIAKGSTWRDIITPNGETFDEFINSLFNLSVFQNEKPYAEAINHENFDEESLARYLTHKWNPDMSKFIKIPRWSKWLPSLQDRLDRSNWNLDINKLHNGEYIDSHSLRPLEQYKGYVVPLLNYLGVDSKLIDLGIEKSKF